MEKDFSLTVYRRLIGEIKNTGWPSFSVRDYFLQRQRASAFFILRHDVDRRPLNALRMALLEHEQGVHATYYFRIRRSSFHENIIRKIARLGHEIGYHYEVMDKARGDARGAERFFEEELEWLRSLSEIRTAAMHGNPLTAWDNRDFWKKISPARFGLLGEAYVSMDDPEIHYVTDTGRGWNRPRYNLLDNFPSGTVKMLPSCTGTEQLIRIIQQKRVKKIYLQVHPNRWSRGRLQWYRQWGEDWFLNGVKALLNLNDRRKRRQ